MEDGPNSPNSREFGELSLRIRVNSETQYIFTKKL
jgi:hypothetical protein